MVETDLLDPCLPEFLGQGAFELEVQHDDIDGNEHDQCPESVVDIVCQARKYEADQHEQTENGNRQLGKTPPAVDEVTDEPLLCSPIANGKELLFTIGEADPRTLAGRALLVLGHRTCFSGLAADEWSLSRRLTLLARRRRVPLGGDGIGCQFLGGDALRFALYLLGHEMSFYRCRLKITRMTESAVPSTSSGFTDQLAEAVQAGFPRAIADLSDLVRIPSVSWDGFDPQQVQRSAGAVKALLEGLGVFETVEIAQARLAGGDGLGQPAVLASRPARNGKPTILLYAHHDVQPPGKDEDWDSVPFEPTVRGERLYGRGAADDKAGVLAHVASIRAFTDVLGTDFDLGLSVFIEGEEEFGSRSFKNFLVDHHDELEADAIVVADSDNWNTTTPALTIALRGNVKLHLTVSTLDHASHSGMFGGAVPDSMLATIKLLATLWDESGSVAVPGLTSYEMSTPDYSEELLREETGLLDGVSPIGTGTILSRIWAQPTVTVTGIDAPTVINASNTLSASTTVVLSSRIAPGQKAADAFAALENHLRANAPFGAHLTISDVDLGDPFLVDTSGQSVADARAAMKEAWGVEPVDTAVGGSIPFLADLVEQFPAAEILVTGVEDPDSRAHSPNESLHLGVFRRAILTEALLLAKLEARA